MLQLLEARPTTYNDTNTVTSEEAASSEWGASLDRTAGASQAAPATEEHKKVRLPPVASPAATNREAAPQSALLPEAPVTAQDLAKVTE